MCIACGICYKEILESGRSEKEQIFVWTLFSDYSWFMGYGRVGQEFRNKTSQALESKWLH